MGIFSKIFGGLKKTKDAIASKISGIFKGKIDDEFYEDLEYVLISSDMGVESSEEIIEELKEKVKENKIKTEEEVKEALREILCDMLDIENIDIDATPIVYMVVGVNGVGKTTSIGKLANYYKEQGKSVLVIAGDTFRAAANQQLSEWAKRSNVRIVQSVEGADPASVVFDGIKSAKIKKEDVVIIDTAGRLHNKVNLMEELKKISRVVEREWQDVEFYKTIVLDAATGQNAVNQVELFDEAIGIDNIILTKLDGTAKGGVVVPIANELQVPISFVGVGEGIDDLIPFDKNDFINAII
ncbi:MAG: signal recognition particle-docking protein FtsY [Clostridia bacterium]|nr:signal recognition particle-docking protein FtsY [Clostridia bacterium]